MAASTAAVAAATPLSATAELAASLAGALAEAGASVAAADDELSLLELDPQAARSRAALIAGTAKSI